MIYENTLPGVFLSRPNRFVAHVETGDEIVISYGTEIEPERTESGFSWYKGYDYVIDGSLERTVI